MKIISINILIFAILISLQCEAQSNFISGLRLKSPEGATIGGIVECEGKPVEGVQVSDGFLITKTDKNGIYNLKSKKQNPQVFITAPSGYEPLRDDAVPQFWAELTACPDQFERHDFCLKKVDNSTNAIVVISDVHLTGKMNDLPTFSKYVDLIRTATDSLTSVGIPVYSIGLGDISYDKHWYETGMDIESSRKILNDNNWNFPFYNILGNHDNDGAVCAGDSTDFISAKRFMKTYGPRYHSQNFGNVHAVFLDNIYFINTPTSNQVAEGINGKCNYVDSISKEQLNWLRLDLTNITPSTPIIIATHSPVFEYDKKDISSDFKLTNSSTKELLEILKSFNNIQFISGHTHKNDVHRPSINGHKILDRNLTATCGYLWWNTGMNDKNIGFDGGPAGFDLYNVNNNDIKFRFIPFEEPADFQYKAWDVNALKDFFSTNCEIQTMRRHFPKWGDFSELPDNSVLVQVWAYDPDGDLSATESGNRLDVNTIYDIQPDLYSTTMLQKSVWMGNYKKAFNSPKKIPMFLITTKTPDSPVEITYTDAYGRTDSRVFYRPKPYGN